MFISACMMVRDEERLLERCVRSFEGAFDELCVVDTGSRDRTPAIARDLGAKVLHLSACNGPDGRIRDFAMARNASLDAAVGDWAMWMDADDVLLPGGAARLRAAAASATADGLQVTIRWGQDEWLQTRLFRNSPENRFVGRIHEYPAVRGSVGEDRAVVVEHLPDKRGKEGSNERNLRLLALEVAENPGNDRALFYLGNAARNLGRLDYAMDCYVQYQLLGRGHPSERQACAYYLALCHFLARRWPDCVAAARRALTIDPRYAETHCLIADALAETGDFRGARRWYASALALGAPPPDAVLFVDRSKYGEHPRRGLARCDARLGP